MNKSENLKIVQESIGASAKYSPAKNVSECFLPDCIAFSALSFTFFNHTVPKKHWNDKKLIIVKSDDYQLFSLSGTNIIMSSTLHFKIVHKSLIVTVLIGKL